MHGPPPWRSTILVLATRLERGPQKPRASTSVKGYSLQPVSQEQLRDAGLELLKALTRASRGYPPGVPTTCPSCGATFEDDTPVCRKCFFVIDHARWNQDGVSPGADESDRAKELEDAPIGPVPVTGDFTGNTSRLFGIRRILRKGRHR